MRQKLLIAAFLMASVNACSTTQKTEGSGLLSVVTQNVLTIAGDAAIAQADFSAVKGKGIQIELSGFVEEKNRGFLTNLVSSKAENEGALLVRFGRPALILEVVVNRAGNDAGKSNVPIIKASRRTEATVDLTLTVRDPVSGQRLSSQRVAALSKYEQAKWVGIVDGKGQYYVRTAASPQMGNGVGARVSEELNNKSWTKVSAP